ncbi:MAG: lysophospholipid acyltransferase family protein [Gemmatimonadota bacterium]
MRTLMFGVVGVLSTTFFSVCALAGALVRAPRGYYDWIHRRWAGSLLLAAGISVRVEGLEKVRRDRPQIFVSNHQSIFDIFALFAALPVSIRFVAKKELSRIPIFAQAMRAAGHVFIDRKDRRAAIEVMRAAGRRMDRETLCLALFPEGTRSRSGRLGPFKKGTFVLAIQTQADLVPVGMDGGRRILRPGRRRITPGPMVLRVGEPFPTAGLTIDDRDEVVVAMREAVVGLLPGEGEENGGADAAAGAGGAAPPLSPTDPA